MKAGPIVVAMGLGLSACAYVSFQKAQTPDEIALKAEIKDFYSHLQSVFAAGNPDALTTLFSDDIAHPMTQTEIAAWAKNFFAKHKTAQFRILTLSIEDLSYIRGVVLISYRVDTPDGTDSFQGQERDTLARRRGRWFITSWEKVKAQ